MTSRLTSTWQRRSLVILCWMLAFSFVVGAVTKFIPGETFFGPPYSVKFVAWGYPQWFRFVVGTGEFVGAMLLVVPRWRFLGAALLLVILEGAVVTHIVNHDPLSASVSAPVTLLLTAVVAWASAPWDWSTLWGARLDEGPARAHDALQRS